ncbi:helix-turn-helix domain-containing protein [Streptomyces tendae]|uniref:helix-turn-helix domain-containing protein n=1 Tax=Streptomyces tendae TaxID=1932 RepID=UPI0038260315
MIGDMAPPSDQTARHLQKLAALVTQRRAQLRLSQEKAAKTCGMAYMTYRKIENGESVYASTYAKLEVGFAMRAGSCKAVLDGGDSITLEDGTELIEGGRITPLDPATLEEGLREAITKGATLTAPNLTLGEVQAINERVVEELRRRGILPSAS